jgi:hypothetical protein
MAYSPTHILSLQKEQIFLQSKPCLICLQGEGSKQGWTTEADLIAGDIRTDEMTCRSDAAA